MTSEKPFELRNRRQEPAGDAAEEAVGETAAVEPGVSTSSTIPVSKVGAVRRVGIGVWVLLGVAIVSVVFAFLSWRDAKDNPDRNRAADRDVAVIEGSKAVETMNTMDHRDVDAGVKAWQGVSTGVLRDQLLAIDQDQKDLISEQGKIATGRVVQAALTDLDEKTARLIVAVEVTVRDGEGDSEPAVKRNRYAADLALVDGVWKIEDLQQVQVTL